MPQFWGCETALGEESESGVRERVVFGVFGLLPFAESVGAKTREIRVIALIDRRKRQVVFLDEVIAAGHGLGLVCRVGHKKTARKRADAELERRRFVVREAEAAADAGALDRVVDEFNAPVAWRAGHRDDARAHRELLDNHAGVGFHAIEFAGVLIQKQKKHGTQERRSISRPSRQTK